MNQKEWEKEFQEKFGGIRANEMEKRWLKTYDEIEDFIRDLLTKQREEIEVMSRTGAWYQGNKEGRAAAYKEIEEKIAMMKRHGAFASHYNAAIKDILSLLTNPK